MNYLSHAVAFVDRPYFVAGVSLPDWLRVVGRMYRARSSAAQSFRETADSQDAIDFADGVIRHHEDDRLFHQNATFIVLSSRFSVELRQLHGSDKSMRSGFLGHIIIELLLDSYLVQQDETLLDRYYRSIESLDVAKTRQYAEAIVQKSVPELERWIVKFYEAKFLVDYSDNERLLFRLNQVMKRVGLDAIESDILPWIETARSAVYENAKQLLALR